MTIHATAIVEDGAALADGVTVGPYCHVGPDVKLGAGCVLGAHVVVAGDTTIGPRATIHPFASIGGPPQHRAHRGEKTRLVIGSDAVIREHVTINTGTAAGRGETRIGDHGFFMASSHVAHDCFVGDHVVFANNASVGGHVAIGDHVFLGGLCAVHQFSRIGPFAFVAGCAAVTTDLIPYGSAMGNHAALAGLNIVGMKRRGMPRPKIHQLRAAYRMLFAEEHSFQERLDEVDRAFSGSEEVMQLVEFLRAKSHRPLMVPRR